MPEATFAGPDLMTFLGLDVPGLTTVGQLLNPYKGHCGVSYAYWV